MVLVRNAVHESTILSSIDERSEIVQVRFPDNCPELVRLVARRLKHLPQFAVAKLRTQGVPWSARLVLVASYEIWRGLDRDFESTVGSVDLHGVVHEFKDEVVEVLDYLVVLED